MKTNRFAAGLAALTMTAAMTYSVDASACGGLFCDSAQPVNQAAERIIFSKNADGTVTAVVQILYEGPAESFAWVLPVPGIPEVGVSSNHLFQSLQMMTNPQYTLNTTVEGECKEEDFRNNGITSAGGNNGNNGNEADGGNNGGVVVLASGKVGPYDYTVLSVDETLPEPVDIALNWLDMNGYDVSSVGPDLLAPYLDKGDNLVAFKLTKAAGQSTGDIRPVTLRYTTDQPCIPIKLTAVAANADMGVMTWVLGAERAVPINYKDLVLNEAMINWFNPNATYNDVITAAAAEAMGQGFVTEYAAPAASLGATFWSPQHENWWTTFSAGTNTDPQSAVNEVCNWIVDFDQFNFNQITWDGWTDVVSDQFAELTPDQINMLEQCYFDQSTPAPSNWDFPTFVQLVQDLVIDPVRNTQQLFDDAGFVTRLYTTMSAGDMTLDPMFDFNAGLSEVSNLHTAERIIECSPKVFQFEAPWRVELANGDVVRGTERDWPFTLATDMPVTEFIQEVGTTGPPTVVVDNTATIAQRLAEHNATVPAGGGDGPKDGAGCACSSVQRAPRLPGAGALVLLMGLFLGLRRKRD